MKHSADSMEQIEIYSTRLGMHPALRHIARTQEQADVLHSIESDCDIIYRNDFRQAKDNNIINPSRDESKVYTAIDTIQNHMRLHYFASEMEMIVLLDALKERLDISSRMLKPSNVLGAILDKIEDELIEAGFSDTNIKTNIIPVFLALIK